MKKTGLFVLSLVVLNGFAFAQNNLPEMVRINGGTFTMGSPVNESGRERDESQRQVTVSSFSMGKYEVTQREYQEVMGTNPSFFKGDDLPVEGVSWFDAIEYCNRRSLQEGLEPAYTISGSIEMSVTADAADVADVADVEEELAPADTISDSEDDRTVTWDRNANGYRLPTEAEWEYACRARTITAYNTGVAITDRTGWYRANSRNSTQPIGQKPANAWGLHDMHGNVWEWCWDWYGTYVPANLDPMGAPSGYFRVYRGGCWFLSAQGVRSAYRGYGSSSDRDYYVGFRVVRNAT